MTGTVPNTLAISCTAERLVAIDTEAQLIDELRRASTRPVNVIGAGSNVVLPARLPGVTLAMRIRGMQVIGRSDEQVLVRAGAGESWHDLVRFCVAQRAYGIENLSLIPGTVGAAPMQNIGAYGVELADHVAHVRAYDRQQGECLELSAADCQFGYRTSRFKRQPGRYCITEVVLNLQARPAPVLTYAGVAEALQRRGISAPHPAQVAELICDIRRLKLPSPKRFPNAGSFFKNPVLTTSELSAVSAHDIPQWPEHAPSDAVAADTQRVKLSAAALIDQAGFKSIRVDGVGVWPRQPLVLVNYGRAGSDAVRAYALRIREAVQDRFGITLEQEPVALGGSEDPPR